MKDFGSFQFLNLLLLTFLLNECRALLCGPTEVYVPHFDEFSENSCSYIGKKKPLRSYRKSGWSLLPGGCACKKHLWRNAEGLCVPFEDCPNASNPGKRSVDKTCPLNEIFSTCADPCLEKQCANIGKLVTCEKKSCTPGCVCNKHYWRNKADVCVTADQCPPIDCPKPNEEYLFCPPFCETYSCKSLYENTFCAEVDDPECAPACVCKEGYLKNNSGICIPIEQCDGYCPEPYTRYNKCGEICAITCENKDNPPVCPINTCTGPGKCLCEDGYVRNSDGKCILPELCGGKK